jgi:magnesium-transporting ATPase (P-type)
VRWPWERWAGVAGIAFVVLYVIGFAVGGEPPDTDAAITDRYADSGERALELTAFFLIAAAALAFVLFVSGARSLLARSEGQQRTLAALAYAGGVVSAALILAGNAVSRTTAFASDDELFTLDPDTQRMFESAGFLLFVSAAFAAILLVVAVSVGALRYGFLPQWLGWAGIVVAVLLPSAFAFVGFVILLAWVLAVAITLTARSPGAPTTVPDQ